ncbi:uncharacterized protein LOC106758805 [Vigna radiata var. radiata]|uniref:Uncharacterized protein LOC106758805 n=1 Tax=Vigna radiata var. radiata TaxID=3916 RepID=A0A1S3TU53_VIGRR|nr:uncharacterized protein LOC106758805 [Vigna radiata var. radiata]XP_014497281.1 uncharacterized protein LOC106758805 [Vigna radiata var. radiata]
MSSGAKLRRHSVGITSSGNNERKVVVPRYLRASIGSCHDICKYGRMNVEEAKQTLSMLKRAGRKSLSRSSEDNNGGIMISVAKQKASLHSKPTQMLTVKSSESVNSVMQISDDSNTNKVELHSKSTGSQKQIGNEVLANTGKASLLRAESSFLSKSHISSIIETRRGEKSSNFEGEIPSKPTSKRVESSPAATSERVKTHPKLTPKMVKASSKSMSTMKQASPKSCFEDKEMQLSEKHATSMKTTSSMMSSEGLGGQRISKIKLKKRKTSPRSSPGGIGSVSARKHRGLKIVPHLMNQPAIGVEPEEHNKEAREKTLYVIKMESANQSPQSDQNESQEIEFPRSNSLSPSSISQTSPQEHQEESEYANTESEEDVLPQNHEFEYQANVDTLETEENGRPQKDVEVAFSEDKDGPKLSGELAETQIDEDNLKSLQMEGEKVSRDNGTDAKSAARTGPEKIVLRPEDVKDKRDGEGLYDNVIEAAASKLVEEGKVKALIHAFENIISLEEKRTLANIFN